MGSPASAHGGLFSSNLSHPADASASTARLSVTAPPSSGNQTPGFVPPASTCLAKAATQMLHSMRRQTTRFGKQALSLDRQQNPRDCAMTRSIALTKVQCPPCSCQERAAKHRHWTDIETWCSNQRPQEVSSKGPSE